MDFVLGAQYGDEGKGKVRVISRANVRWLRLIVAMCIKLTDHLLATNSYDLCARAQGGHNAGHSVKTGGKCVAARTVSKGSLTKDQPTVCTCCPPGS